VLAQSDAGVRNVSSLPRDANEKLPRSELSRLPEGLG
jgi:hypothetical protein